MFTFWRDAVILIPKTFVMVVGPSAGCGHLARNRLVPSTGCDQGDKAGQLRLHAHRRSGENRI